MGKILRQAVVAAWITMVCCASVRAGIVFGQLPNRTGGQGSDTDFLSNSGQQVWQLLADNVEIAFSADIRRITWWGFYGSDFDTSPGAHDPPTGDETMRIRFYAPRPSDGLPDSGNILFEESFLNPPRTATGFTIAVGQRPMEYEYVVDLGSPFRLASDTLYWLEIAQIGDQESHFRWERATGLIAGSAFLNLNVTDWTSAIGSYAVQLSTIPEPGSGFLAISACAFLCLMRWGRRRAARA